MDWSIDWSNVIWFWIGMLWIWFLHWWRERQDYKYKWTCPHEGCVFRVSSNSESFKDEVSLGHLDSFHTSQKESA